MTTLAFFELTFVFEKKSLFLFKNENLFSCCAVNEVTYHHKHLEFSKHNFEDKKEAFISSVFITHNSILIENAFEMFNNR